MKILNNRYRIIKELPIELKTNTGFVVHDLGSDNRYMLQI